MLAGAQLHVSGGGDVMTRGNQQPRHATLNPEATALAPADASQTSKQTILPTVLGAEPAACPEELAAADPAAPGSVAAPPISPHPAQRAVELEQCPVAVPGAPQADLQEGFADSGGLALNDAHAAEPSSPSPADSPGFRAAGAKRHSEATEGAASSSKASRQIQRGADNYDCQADSPEARGVEVKGVQHSPQHAQARSSSVFTNMTLNEVYSPDSITKMGPAGAAPQLTQAVPQGLCK